MRPIWIVAKNTYMEIIRDRILYGIFVVAVLLIFLSLALGELSFGEQQRITTNFGLAAIQLSAMVLSIFLGSTLVFREIEKKTIMTLLVRPVSRLQFLLGKCAGLLMAQVTVMAVLGCTLVLIYLGLEIPINRMLALAMYGTFLEASVILGITILFGIFATPTMVIAFSLGIFLIGHWLDSLLYFTKKSESDLVRWVADGFTKIFPNFEVFNWRSAVVHEDPIQLAQCLWASTYAFGWFVLTITLATVLFRRRDFN